MASHAQQRGMSLRDEVDLILVDAEMPEMDGCVLTRNIKSDAASRHPGGDAFIPVVGGQPGDGQEVGVDAYVAKFDADVLAETLRPLLACQPSVDPTRLNGDQQYVGPQMKFLCRRRFSTMRRIVRNLLKELGFANVDEAEGWQIALQKLNSALRFRRDRLEHAQHGRSDPAPENPPNPTLKHLPVLMITAEAKKENIIAAAQAGAPKRYIVKPFTAATLSEKLKDLRKMGKEGSLNPPPAWRRTMVKRLKFDEWATVTTCRPSSTASPGSGRGGRPHFAAPGSRDRRWRRSMPPGTTTTTAGALRRGRQRIAAGCLHRARRGGG